MVLVGVILVASLLAGLVTGGRLRNLARVRIRAVWLVLAAAGLQGVLHLVSLRGGPVELVGLPLLAGSQVALLGFMFANRLLPGMTLVLVGFALNAAVIIPNGAMPVSAGALEAIGGDPAAVDPGKHRLLTDDDAVWWLADVIPLPPLRTVVSVGDIVLAAGIAVLVPSLMRRPPARRSPHATRAAEEDDADDAEDAGADHTAEDGARGEDGAGGEPAQPRSQSSVADSPSRSDVQGFQPSSAAARRQSRAM